MYQYPNQGQNDPTQPSQYPNQGTENTDYGRYSPSPNMPPYTDQQSQQPPQPPFQQGGYQPPFQQGGYQQGPHPSYQQQMNYQQSPYQQSPYPQSPTISLDYRNIIAGLGAFVALISFFIPYYTIPFSFSDTATSGYSIGGRYWLDFILALAALAIVILLQFGEQWFKSSSNPTIQRVVTSLTSQPRTWYTRLIAIGGFSIFFHFILDLGRLSIWSIGSWLYLLGAIAIVVGGVLFIKPPVSTATLPIR